MIKKAEKIGYGIVKYTTLCRSFHRAFVLKDGLSFPPLPRPLQHIYLGHLTWLEVFSTGNQIRTKFIANFVVVLFLGSQGNNETKYTGVTA